MRDGFWVRAIIVMSQAAWAEHVQMQYFVHYNSTSDSYGLIGSNKSHARTNETDGWRTYFEPVASSAALAAGRIPPESEIVELV